MNIRAAAAESQNRFMDASFTRQSPPSEHLAHPGPEELEVTIKSHRTYMNLTDAFFKQTFARNLRRRRQSPPNQSNQPGPLPRAKTSLRCSSNSRRRAPVFNGGEKCSVAGAGRGPKGKPRYHNQGPTRQAAQSPSSRQGGLQGAQGGVERSFANLQWATDTLD